ncbi:MAG: oligosaccharide repeat unit polymerase [Butyrivibrio sp.]|nr:oligosaccharide repeat unit polymerase [Butyrivibrio sp.]
MIIYLLLIFVIMATIVSYKSLNRDCFSPPTMLCASFILPISLAIINMEEWELELDFETVLIVMTAMISFYVGFKFFSCQDKNAVKSVVPMIKFKKYTNLIYIIGLVYTIIEYYFFVQSIGMANTLSENLIAARLAKSSGEISPPAMLETLFSFYRMTSIVYVYNFAISKFLYHKYFLEGAVVSVLTIVLTVLPGARGYVVFTIVSYCVTWMIVWELCKKDKIHFAWKKIFSYLGWFTLLIVLFFASVFFFGRADLDNIDDNIVMYMIKYLSGYIGGELKGLNDYVVNVYSPIKDDIPFGSYTLLSFYEWISRHFNEYTWLSSSLQDFFNRYYYDKYGVMIGNVYTAFGTQYEDCGLFGVLLFNLIEGMFFGYMYYKLLPSTFSVNRYGFSWILLLYAYFYYTIPLTFFAGFFYIMFSIGMWKIFAFIWIFERVGLKNIRKD